MKLSALILGSPRRFVKAVNVRLWLALERLAKAILARSWHHINPEEQHKRAVHSDALHKAPIVHLTRPERRQFPRFEIQQSNKN